MERGTFEIDLDHLIETMFVIMEDDHQRQVRSGVPIYEVVRIAIADYLRIREYDEAAGLR
jgi:hypothetical protein